ncbi:MULTISPECIES: hypothetical protein [Rhodococcus]|uniref:hypothetical protein n=1 Tax=Rhodococcus TaxID=1827 RepID=UPI00138E51E5|nr:MULTISPECIES: hypothetical protein [Rhodococcus]WAM18960.1 hypothetical protein OYT95_35265 [Rhodococcus sp. JS3073]
MHEDVRSSVVGCDESEAVLTVEPLHNVLCHADTAYKLDPGIRIEFSISMPLILPAGGGSDDRT